MWSLFIYKCLMSGPLRARQVMHELHWSLLMVNVIFRISWIVYPIRGQNTDILFSSFPSFPFCSFLMFPASSSPPQLLQLDLAGWLVVTMGWDHHQGVPMQVVADVLGLESTIYSGHVFMVDFPSLFCNGAACIPSHLSTKVCPVQLPTRK